MRRLTLSKIWPRSLQRKFSARSCRLHRVRNSCGPDPQFLGPLPSPVAFAQRAEGSETSLQSRKHTDSLDCSDPPTFASSRRCCCFHCQSPAILVAWRQSVQILLPRAVPCRDWLGSWRRTRRGPASQKSPSRQRLERHFRHTGPLIGPSGRLAPLPNCAVGIAGWWTETRNTKFWAREYHPFRSPCQDVVDRERVVRGEY
mmetsp:Transcript_15242/g.42185  ORF Transcript_15242/g.42185 Transcript_15242/m.42185 type:complete len:201 (-) Transcript_15242:435-1037(-)